MNLGKKLTFEEIKNLEDGTKVYIKELREAEGWICSSYAIKKENRLTKVGSGEYYNITKNMFFFYKKEDMEVYEVLDESNKSKLKGEDNMFNIGEFVYVKGDLEIKKYNGVDFVRGMLPLREKRFRITNFDSKAKIYKLEGEPWSFKQDMLQKESYYLPLKTKCMERNGFKLGDKVKYDGNIGTVIDFYANKIGIALDNPMNTGHNCCGGVNGNLSFVSNGRWINSLNLELVKESKTGVDIEINGMVTTVRFDGVEAKSKRNPSDVNNEKIGVGVALERLGKELILQGEKEVREAKKKNIESFNISSHFNDFFNERIAVLCDTEEKAKDFLSALDILGLKWRSGESLVENSNWNYYKDETCYLCSCGKIVYGAYSLRKEKVVKF